MKRAFLTVCIMLLFLAGCRAQSGVEITSGEPLSHGEQQSLYEQRSKQESEPDAGAKGTVYWTQSGTKYHKSPDCTHIKNAKELQSGTVAQAINHGTDGPCSRCFGD